MRDLRLLSALMILATVVLTPRVVMAQGCGQTLSAGANVAAAVSSVTPGTVICLNSGSYGSVSLTNVTKSPRITITSVTPLGATFSLTTGSGADGIIVDGVTLTGWRYSGSAQNITVQNSRFTGQADLNLCGAVNRNILIDNNTFINISVGPSANEGRLHIAQPACLGSQPVGVTVTRSRFENNVSGLGESDGIQIGAYGVVIGPGNAFKGIRQANFTRHVDAIQLYGQSHTTITGNYFEGNDPHLGAYDGGNGETITNNIFVNTPGSGGLLQLGGGMTNPVFTHNTLITANGGSSLNLIFNAKSPNTTGALVRDNIFRGTTMTPTGCSGCSFTHNMFASGGTGTNNIIGSPTFVGGTFPSTWAGFQLAPTSAGKAAATDGQDMGSGYFGGSITFTPPPATPTNLRIVR